MSRCIFLQAIVELYDLGLKKTNIIISSFWNGAHQSQGDDERHREPSMELKTSLNNVHLSYNGEICFLEVTSLQSWGKKANKRIQYNCHYHANTCKSIYVCLKRKQCKTDKTGTSSKWNRLLVSALIYEFHFTPGQCLIFFFNPKPHKEELYHKIQALVGDLHCYRTRVEEVTLHFNCVMSKWVE